MTLTSDNRPKPCAADGCSEAAKTGKPWARFCSTRCRDRERARRTRETRRARDRALYRRSPERRAATIASARATNEVKRQAIRELKEASPCADCGQSFPYYVMDFDHVRGEKRMAVGQMVTQGYALDAILAEVAKCDLVCANCHRVRTFTRKGGE